MSLMQLGAALLTAENMTDGEQYLRQVLARYSVDTGPFSPLLDIQRQLTPLITTWANGNMRWLAPSGSFAKGTAVHTGTDFDLFISLRRETEETLSEIYEKLVRKVAGAGFRPKRKNCSVGIRFHGYDVDLVPGRQLPGGITTKHSLHRERDNSVWKMTDVQAHVAKVRGSMLLDEIRLFKIWRDRNGLEFPSFYLELILMDAMPIPFLIPKLEDRMQTGFAYIRDNILSARIVDPANSNNVLSNELTIAEKRAIRAAASDAFDARYWSEFVW
ncbi:MAG: nucleotidyltransferase [Mesorhizobium sp.]|uniref:nucleotidyltransferase n=1 Tax=Mesorhizobium sp. TaxID=1871066 RepID=UPI0011FCE105|nr:nucleotidyltransferase [Mesorhizobium sp.]TIM26515.1 MAG: nucleotidyltransferase [Mesorhizobium sp.]